MLRTRKQLKSKKTRRRRLRLESLEGRRLLAADIGFAAEELEETSIIPEFSPDVAAEVSVYEDSEVIEVLPMDPISLEELSESPEMVQPGSLETSGEILELTTFDSGNELDESLEDSIVTMELNSEIAAESSVVEEFAETAMEEAADPINGQEIYYVQPTAPEATQAESGGESEAEAGGESEAIAESESIAESDTAPEPQMSVNAATFNWTFGEYTISAENFSLQLFVATESDEVESTAIDVTVVDEADPSSELENDEPSETDASGEEEAEVAESESEGTESETNEAGPESEVDETEVDETEVDETDNDVPTEEPEVLPPHNEETGEELDDPDSTMDESAEQTVETAGVDDVSEVITVDAPAGTTVNIQVTVNVGEPAAETESDAEPSEAELTLDIIEEVLNDDGFVLVAFPADDLQAVLNGDFDAASFDEIVLLESPPEAISEEIVESELPEAPVVEDPVAEDSVTEDPATEDPVAEDPVAEDPVAEDPAITDCSTTESSEADSSESNPESDPEGEVVIAGEETTTEGEDETAEDEAGESEPAETGSSEDETPDVDEDLDAGGDPESEEQCEVDVVEESGDSETGEAGEVAETEAAETGEVDDSEESGEIDDSDGEEGETETEETGESETEETGEVDESEENGDPGEVDETEGEVEAGGDTEEHCDLDAETDEESGQGDTGEDGGTDVDESGGVDNEESGEIDETEGDVDLDGEAGETETGAGGEESEETSEAEETESGETSEDVAETPAEGAVSVVGELYGFVQLLVGDMPWSELQLSADTLTITSPGSEMVFGGFEMVLMNQSNSDDSLAAIAAVDDPTETDSESDSETDLLPSDTYEQDIDEAICVWDPLETCMDALDEVLA